MKTFKEYQDEANKTICKDLGTEDKFINGALGLMGEAGEVGEIIKKWKYHKHELNLVELKKELGDVMWYLNLLSNAMQEVINKEESCHYLDPVTFTLSGIGTNNIEKLRKRYGEEFTVEKSINRTE